MKIKKNGEELADLVIGSFCCPGVPEHEHKIYLSELLPEYRTALLVGLRGESALREELQKASVQYQQKKDEIRDLEAAFDEELNVTKGERTAWRDRVKVLEEAMKKIGDIPRSGTSTAEFFLASTIARTALAGT
jgi:hypothetical protein